MGGGGGAEQFRSLGCFFTAIGRAKKVEKDGKKVLTNSGEGDIVSKLSVTQRRGFRKSVVMRKKCLTKRMSGGKILNVRLKGQAGVSSKELKKVLDKG